MAKKEDLQQIIEAGLYAASGMGKQATITLAITNKEVRDKLAAVNCKLAAGRKGSIRFTGRRQFWSCWPTKTVSPMCMMAA